MSLRSKRKRERTSSVWMCFRSGLSPNSAICVGCELQVPIHTGNMGGHILKCEGINDGLKNRYVEACKPQKKRQTVLAENGFPRVPLSSDRQKMLRLKWAELVLDSRGRVLALRDRKAFRAFIDVLAGNTYKIPSYPTTRADILQVADKSKAVLIAYFKSRPELRPSVVFDLWKSKAHKHYLGVVSHWVDYNGDFQHCALALKEFHDAHSGANIADAIIKILDEFGIIPGLFVADNASNVKKASEILVEWANCDVDGDRGEVSNEETVEALERVPLDELAGALKDKNICPVIDAHSMGCSCHLMNLAINYSLAGLKTEFKALRKLATGTRENQVFRQFMSEHNRFFQLQSDVVTRWTSTYRLLGSFCGVAEKVQELAMRIGDATDKQKATKPMRALQTVGSSEVGTLFKQIRQVLLPVISAMTTLEGDRYPTLSLLQLWTVMLSVNITNHLKNVESLKDALPHYFDRYIDMLKTLRNEILTRMYKPVVPGEPVPIEHVVALLDPRTKCLLHLDDTQVKIVVDHTKTLLPRISVGSNDHTDDVPAELCRPGMTFQDVATPEEQLDAYMRLRPVGYGKNAADPGPVTSFWRTHRDRFPAVAALARVYLGFVASSASVERMFSQGGLVLGVDRCRMNGLLLEAYVLFRVNSNLLSTLENG